MAGSGGAWLPAAPRASQFSGIVQSGVPPEPSTIQVTCGVTIKSLACRLAAITFLSRMVSWLSIVSSVTLPCWAAVASASAVVLMLVNCLRSIVSRLVLKSVIVCYAAVGPEVGANTN
jgi:hypothetical protein